MRHTLTRQLLSLTVIGLVTAIFFGTPHRRPWSPVTLEAQYTGSNPLAYWVPPGNCNSAVSGNSTGTQGLTVDGSSNIPVVQARTSATGTNTHTYVCNITPPYYIVSTTNGFAINDAVFMYDAVNQLGTQAATLTSGTFNGTTVFTSIGYPTPGASETASVAPTRAGDGGSIVITPVAGSFNVTTSGAGTYYSAKFAPVSPIQWRTDNWQLLLNVTLQGITLTPTTTTTPGVLVHYIGQ